MTAITIARPTIVRTIPGVAGSDTERRRERAEGSRERQPPLKKWQQEASSPKDDSG
jgi:hypothetical protein